MRWLRKGGGGSDPDRRIVRRARLVALSAAVAIAVAGITATAGTAGATYVPPPVIVIPPFITLPHALCGIPGTPPCPTTPPPPPPTINPNCPPSLARCLAPPPPPVIPPPSHLPPPVVPTTTTTAAPPAPSTTTSTTTPGNPTLLIVPADGPPGFVATAAGHGFAPSSVVVLTWSKGIGTWLVPTDATGSFSLGVLIFDHDLLGPRNLVATDHVNTAQVGFLVVPGDAQPHRYVGPIGRR